MLHFFERLKELRVSRDNMSQKAFAEIGGVSKRSQIDYEKGSSFPNAQYLMALVEAGFDVKYLLTGKRDYADLNPKQLELLDLYHGVPPEEREMILEILMLWHVYEPLEQKERTRKQILQMLLKSTVLPKDEATMLRLYEDASPESKNFILAELLRGQNPELAAADQAQSKAAQIGKNNIGNITDSTISGGIKQNTEGD